MAETETVSDAATANVLLPTRNDALRACVDSYQVTTSSGSKTTVEKPPLPRNQTNLSGLQNQGGTW